MKIAISGSGGYIAAKLIPELEAENTRVIRIKRDVLSDSGRLAETISGADVVINLAGAPIFAPWSPKNKEVIRESRVQSTENIVAAINLLPANKQAKLLISASAIGIYESNLTHTETSASFANGFVGGVVKAWEQATNELNPEIRKVIFRIGMVLGKDAKALQSLVPLFRFGLGGKLGSGKQPFPFIHVDDLVRAVRWSISNPQAQGIYNLVAPQQISNNQFTKALAQAVRRPAIFTVPGVVLRTVLGETSSLLLQNPIVYPERLLNQGFVFSFPEIDACLKQILR